MTRMLIVHPGTLPTSVYEVLLTRLDYVDVEVVNLSANRAYGLAALDPNAPDPTLDDLAQWVLASTEFGIDEIDLVVGWSFGGLVAAALHAISATGPSVLLLDTVPPVVEPDSARQDAVRWFGDYLTWRAGQKKRAVSNIPSEGSLEDLYLPALAAGAIAADVSAAGFRMLARAYRAGLERNFRIAAAANMAQLSPVNLVKPEQGLLMDNPTNGWNLCSDSVRVTACPGDHYSMLTDPQSVEVIAAEIVRLISPST